MNGAVVKFQEFGLPGVLGPAIGILETIAAPLLAVGLFPTAAAGALGAVIAGALVTVQIPAGVTPGLERDLLILAGTAVLLARGPGRLSLDGWRSAGRG